MLGILRLLNGKVKALWRYFNYSIANSSKDEEGSLANIKTNGY
jgi:hypothetical protein